MGFILLEGLL